jgi:predicted TIM-barrel fold metal-dependent hydrolase
MDAHPIRIIDAHCHIASEDFIPRSFVDGSISNLAAALTAQGVSPTRAQLTKLYERKMQDPSCDELIAEMAAAGIEKSILLAADFTWALKDCTLTIEESFVRHAEVRRRHAGKLEVFGGVDPRWGKDGLALLERSFTELGFRGFKVYPPCGFSPSDPALFPFYELCAAHRAPVVVHVGPTSPALAFDTASPFLIDAAARQFPTVSFILAHGSVSYREECAMLCAFRPNVFLDISGYQGESRGGGMAAAVRAVVSRGINHKILFGTDWPVYRMQGSQAGAVEAVLAEDGPLAELSDLEQALVLHGNALRLLGGA